MGIPQGYPDYVLHKMVTVMRGGEEVKISKRAGSYVTLRDLIDEVGRDAVRFFLVSRKADTRVRVRRRSRAVADGGESRSTTCSTRTRAFARCCGRPGSRSSPKRRRLLADADLVGADESLRRGAAAPARRFSGRARRRAARDLAPHQRHVLSQGFGRRNSTVTIMRSDSWSMTSMSGVQQARAGGRRGQVLKNGLAVLSISAPEQM